MARYNRVNFDRRRTYEEGRHRAIQAVDSQLVQTYWEIGYYIVELEQGGEFRANTEKCYWNN